MNVQVQKDGKVTVQGPDNFKEFALHCDGGIRPDDLDRALRSAGAGRAKDGYAWISSAWLAEVCGGGPEWQAGFLSMREYASQKGWVDDEGAIRAHIVAG